MPPGSFYKFTHNFPLAMAIHVENLFELRIRLSSYPAHRDAETVRIAMAFPPAALSEVTRNQNVALNKAE